MNNFQAFCDLQELKRSGHLSVSFLRPKIVQIVLQDQELQEVKNLRYYKRPSPPLDLNLGYANYKMRNHADENFKVLENFLMKNIECDFFKHKNKQKILTSRNVLRLLMNAPYSAEIDERYPWTIHAMKIGNCIFLVKKVEQPEFKNKHGTYHFKFQQYCFANSPTENPKIYEPIDENKQTFCVFESALDDFDILYTCEIAGVKSDRQIKNFHDPDVLNDCCFVSTKLLPDYIGDGWKNDKKIIQWWTQSFLGRVDEIYFGFKTKGGLINQDVQSVRVEDLLKNQKWDPKICETFLDNFLNKIQLTLKYVNDPKKVVEFKFSPPFKTINYRVVDAMKGKNSFLSEEFINFMHKKNF